MEAKITNWVELFKNEGIDSAAISKLYDNSLVSAINLINGGAEKDTFVLWTWREGGQKFTPLERVQNGMYSSEQHPLAEDVKMYVGVGRWGLLNLIRTSNAFENS